MPDVCAANSARGGSAMRTREEQISRLRNDLRAGKSDIIEWEDMSKACIAEAHILEAEARAEARVRAEIARDSERLDWLCHMISGYQIQEVGRIMPYGGGLDSWRKAIDAAREVGE